MANNVLSLALKINADATGVRLGPTERALEQLGKATDRVNKVFTQFGDSSEAAAAAQERTTAAIDDLVAKRRAGTVTAREFAEQFNAIAEGAREEAAALRRAAQITEQNLTPLQRYDRALEELDGQLRAGRISQDTYNRALDRAKSQLGDTSAQANRTDRSIESLTKNVRLLAAIEVGRAIIDGLQLIGRVISNVTNRIASLISSVRQSLDEIDKLSLRTGISREALQGYGVAAELAGVSTDQLGATLQRLATNIGRATPPAELQQGLQQLNLTLEELRQLSPEEQFALIADRISQLPTAAQRAGAAFGVLGESGVQLTSLLGQSGNALEELRERTERLGIIVSDEQIANVTELNDTFTLVRRTVEGIIGQVVGNLAPAVTAVAEQFLQFVEAFEGTQSGGGTGIADAITEALFDAADYFAIQFDLFAEYFSGFGDSLENTAQIFSVVGNVLTGIFEGFRAIFNAFQVNLLRIQEGLGRILEGVGSWVSSDLEEFGRNLAEATAAEAEKQTAQLQDAATNAANAFNRALDGGSGSTTQAGEGAASRFMAGVRAQFERERSPEFRVVSNLEETEQKLAGYLALAGDGADRFLAQSLSTLEALREQAEAGELTAEQIAKMNQFADEVNKKLNREISQRTAAAEAAAKQAEADAKRIEGLTKATDATAKIREDLAAVEREIARVQQATFTSDAEANNAARARLEELARLRTELDQRLQAASQGFADGFEKAFEETNNNFTSLTEKAAEFGDAGLEAAEKLRRGIVFAQVQASRGILSREAYEAEVERQRELYEQQIANVRQIAQERQRVNEFVDNQLALQQFGGDSQRLEASRRVAEIEAEIARVQQEIEAARNAGLEAEANAGVARLAQLDQVAAKERDIASGRAKAEEELAARREEAVRRQEEIIKAQSDAQSKLIEQQKKAFEEQSKAAAAEAERQAERIRGLNSIGTQSIQAGDIRSEEGARQFISAAAGAFDPNLAELRAQSKLLAQIVVNSGALQFLEAGVGRTVTFLRGGA